jgi:hypothetical protein
LCTSALTTYAFDGGLAGSIPVHRLMPNIDCDPNGATLPPALSDFGFSGAWYDPLKSGQGFVVEINPENGQAMESTDRPTRNIRSAGCLREPPDRQPGARRVRATTGPCNG